MRGRTKDLLFLTFLALVFTAGLTFASIELPSLVDAYLGKSVASPDVATGLNELSNYKTDLYLDYFHLRPVGYISLALIVVLIIVGFATEIGLIPIYSTTRREALEEHGEAGSVKMTHRFEHQRFRRYGR